MKNISLAFLLLVLFSCQLKMVGHSIAAQDNAPQELRVLCYNIHHGNPPSKTGVIDIEAIARVITDARADVVALQEVDKHTGRSGNIDEAKILAEKTGLHYQFFKAIDHDGGDYGLAILSGFPLQDTMQVSLPQQVKAENRILAFATLRIAGQNIIFANTHLDASKPHENRIVQMQEIVKTFESEKLPVILCGDLNSVAGSETINLLDSRFIRTCITDCSGTVPQQKPFRTIDYIATKNIPWSLLSYEVIAETYASDHRPILAIFKIR